MIFRILKYCCEVNVTTQVIILTLASGGLKNYVYPFPSLMHSDVSARYIFLDYSCTKESHVFMFSFLHFVNEMLVGSLTSVDRCGAGVERGAAWRCELRACVTSSRCQSLRCRVRVRACERAALCEYRRVSLCHLLLHLHNQYAIFINLQ